MMIAYCHASGRINFCRSWDAVPSGAIAFLDNDGGPFGHLSDQGLRDAVSVKARHGKRLNTLLVPGVPEASSQPVGLDALEKWCAWAFPGSRFAPPAKKN
ncbi:hypothetical protein [Roseibium sp.]|uniref:hypothetical protein n=1 Tax=Roseibium sp. TaxID=1936156 RepID=UPI0032641012